MAFPVIPAVMAGSSALGALMSKFGKPNKAKTTQLPLYSKQQTDWMNQLGQMGMQGLQDPGAGFQPIADQAREQFYSKTMPGIAERFAGLGGTRSSAYQGAMAGAGQGLESDLAAQQAQYGLQNRASLSNIMQMGLGRQFENIYQPETPGVMQTLGSSLMGQGLGGLGQIGAAKYLGDQQSNKTSDAIKLWQSLQGANNQGGYSPLSYSGGLGYSRGQ